MSSTSKRIALVCPSSIDFMPYVDNYESIFRSAGVDYDLILWDRFGDVKVGHRFIYRDSKMGHKRNVIDYCRYVRFIATQVDLKLYSGVVIFGLQLAFFLQRLLSRFSLRYVVDVRDHNRALNFYGVRRVLREAEFVVISSPGYAEWAHEARRLIINHNTNSPDINALPEVTGFPDGLPLRVACIGALRDLEVNIALIDSVAFSSSVSLAFHGQGDINDRIQSYVEQKRIGNVILTGRYSRSDEAELYRNASFVNVLRYNDGINNRTALPNRLYNSAIAGRPMLALSGTYLAEVVGTTSLGLVVDTLDDVETSLVRYVSEFDCDRFDRFRRTFMENVLVENQEFRSSVEQFCLQ